MKFTLDKRSLHNRYFKKMVHKCIVWGIGWDYETIVNQLHFEVAKGNIEVVALVARQQDIVGKQLDGYSVITKEELIGVKFDYLIVASFSYYSEICNQAIAIGINEDKIINGCVMKLPFFDFDRYIQLIEGKITILSDDCWGGYIYHRLFMKFCSPTINLSFGGDRPKTSIIHSN